jgi:hypothetical protein
VDFGDTVIDDLNSVVQIGKLVLLAANVACKDVFEHLGDIGVVIATVLLLLVGLLLMDLLRGKIGLLLMPGGTIVTGAVRFFACVGVCSGNNELVNFERVGVLSGGCTDTEVVSFWEIDLGNC